MRVLAVDTATPQVCAAYVDSDRHAVIDRTAADPRKHVELLTSLITEVLDEAGVTLADIELVVTGVGPGPYTGLRVAVVTATTLGMVLGVPVVGVCTLDGFAHDASSGKPVIAASDARRREVYWAVYGEPGLRTYGPLVTKPDVVLTKFQHDVVGSAASHVTPGATDVVLRASALAECAIDALNRGEVVAGASDDDNLSQMEGDGAGSVPLSTLLPPRPLYLRQPDAQVPLAMRGAV